MPFTHERTGDTVLYTFYGRGTKQDVNLFFNTSIDYYEEIGDAYGLIIDIRQRTNIPVANLRAIQKNLKGMRSNMPIAVVTERPGPIKAIVLTFDALSGNGIRHTNFFKTIPQARTWLDQWFVDTYGDRSSLRGIKNSILPPRPT